MSRISIPLLYVFILTCPLSFVFAGGKEKDKTSHSAKRKKETPQERLIRKAKEREAQEARASAQQNKTQSVEHGAIQNELVQANVFSEFVTPDSVQQLIDNLKSLREAREHKLIVTASVANAEKEKDAFFKEFLKDNAKLKSISTNTLEGYDGDITFHFTCPTGHVNDVINYLEKITPKTLKKSKSYSELDYDVTSTLNKLLVSNKGASKYSQINEQLIKPSEFPIGLYEKSIEFDKHYQEAKDVFNRSESTEISLTFVNDRSCLSLGDQFRHALYEGSQKLINLPIVLASNWGYIALGLLLGIMAWAKVKFNMAAQIEAERKERILQEQLDAIKKSTN